MTSWPELPLVARASWPSYLVAIGLTFALLAIVWFNIRSRRRVRRPPEERREREPLE